MNSQGGVSERDPVFQGDDGKWNFWDETWASFYGPYDTEDAARAALAGYVKALG